MANNVSTLNDLIETLKDGKLGFENAASHVKNPQVKSTFMEFAQQRSQFASELQAHVRTHGGEPEKSGSTSAAMHRGWIDLKSAMGGGDKSILNEAERGEDVAVKAYKTAIDSNLPADCLAIVQRQFTQVKAAHDKVKALRDSTT